MAGHPVLFHRGTSALSARRRRHVTAVLAAVALLAACTAPPPEEAPARARRAPAEVPVLQAPAGPDDADLDLHLRFRDGWLRQTHEAGEGHWAFRQFSELVVLEGVAHRAILMQPSLEGAPALLAFKVAVPAGVATELVTWVALEAKQARRSDGVDFAVAVADVAADPGTLPLAFDRLDGDRVATAWREVRVDLARAAGRTVWIVLAARDAARRGDWLLWGDPRVRLTTPPSPAVVDLGAPEAARARPRAVPWSEATVFKTYSLFNDETAQWKIGDWLRRSFPWLEGLRLFSALGANWGPSLAADYASAVGDSPAANSETERRWSEHYEFFRDGGTWPERPFAERLVWGPFDGMNAAAAASGLALHPNLAGAPEWFTGRHGYYRNYHFNELPVADEEAWRAYVDALFAHLATQSWFPRARFSLFTEPNCVWIDAEDQVRRVGFQGDAAAFARQYLATWRAAAPHLAPGQVYLGPFVVEPDPGEPRVDNLRAYLESLVGAFAAAGEPLPAWSAFAFNLYETPQLGLDGFAPLKLAAARATLDAVLPDVALPIRIDELGVHPLVSGPFEAATGVKLGTTRWDMSWTAEVLALLVEQHVTRAATWFPVLIAYPPDQPLKAWASYAFLSAVAGAVDVVRTPEGAVDAVRAPADAPPPGLPAPTMQIRLASRSADRIGWAWGEQEGSVRLAVWHHPRFIRADDAAGAESAARAVVVRLPGGAARRVRLVGFADQLAASGLPTAGAVEIRAAPFGGLPRFVEVVLPSAEGSVPLTLRPGDLWLVETE